MRNSGGAATSGEITVADELPPGLTVQGIEGEVLQAGATPQAMECTEATVTCTYDAPVNPDSIMVVNVYVVVATAEERRVSNVARVEGGGATMQSTHEPTTEPNGINGPVGRLRLAGFGLTANESDGGTDTQAGSHPYEVTTTAEFATKKAFVPAAGARYLPIEEPRNVAVYLPLGFVGNPTAAEQCPIASLTLTNTKSGCPAASMVGFAAVSPHGRYFASNVLDAEATPIYNLKPEGGVPAEFGFTYFGVPIFMTANVVRAPLGYRLRVVTSGIPEEGIDGFALTFFGKPTEKNKAGGPPTAFFTNPTQCAPAAARIEVDSWSAPSIWSADEAQTFPEMTGCDALTFAPLLEAAPEATTTDSPAGYQVKLTVPQASNVFGNLATPDLRNATVALPAGVSLSPAAGDGLAGCPATGPGGIDIPTEVNARGEQLHPDEAGEGEEIDPYGLSKLAAGHCPAKSQIGSVELKTPLLAEPLKGHVYVAEPSCGGAGQAECTAKSAEDGELYGLYLEVSGSGVIIKLKGEMSVDLATGQITTSFKENPQFPFEELKLTLDGGQRAALATPQSCGAFTTTSDLEPWSAPESGPDATPSSSFEVTGCGSPMPFKPGFQAGTVKPLGGEFSPFVMSMKRNDGEQDLGGVSITMPSGLTGMISKVPLCGRAQADAGACPESSRIGTAHVAAGPGSEPLWLEGRVYLAAPYIGDPFGLSIVVPAKAGPFNLGNEVVRAGISVNPRTAQVSVTSQPLRLIRDGVPFRIKEINVTVDRPGFIFNPTSCSQLHLTGSITGDLPDGSAGSSVPVASPFAVAGCKNLPFHPGFKVTTRTKHSRLFGAYLRVHVTSSRGQANIKSVRVELPKILAARDETLNQACSEKQFAANPAGCPKGSFVGTAIARTPVLPVPLRGPAIFVSHGGVAFPDLDVVLQGDGVTIDLTGNTNIVHDITISNFKSIPDVPVNSFQLTLPIGPHSALAANGNLCTKSVKRKTHGHVVFRRRRRTLAMPTTIVGQNGAVIEKTTKIAVEGCGRVRKSSPKGHSKR